MNEQIKTEWIAALRSGEYPQGKNQLRSDAGYCCLGVLCALHAKAGLGEWGNVDFGAYVYLGDLQLPPEVVMVWAGLEPGTIPYVDGTAITMLNDGIMHYDPSSSFVEIADLIEEYL